MANDEKLCVDCRHHWKRIDGKHKCRRRVTSVPDLVTGGMRNIGYRDAYYERDLQACRHNGSCIEDLCCDIGRFFEPKEKPKPGTRVDVREV